MQHHKQTQKKYFQIYTDYISGIPYYELAIKNNCSQPTVDRALAFGRSQIKLESPETLRDAISSCDQEIRELIEKIKLIEEGHKEVTEKIKQDVKWVIIKQINAEGQQIGEETKERRLLPSEVEKTEKKIINWNASAGYRNQLARTRERKANLLGLLKSALPITDDKETVVIYIEEKIEEAIKQ